MKQLLSTAELWNGANYFLVIKCTVKYMFPWWPYGNIVCWACCKSWCYCKTISRMYGSEIARVMIPIKVSRGSLSHPSDIKTERIGRGEPNVGFVINYHFTLGLLPYLEIGWNPKTTNYVHRAEIFGVKLTACTLEGPVSNSGKHRIEQNANLLGIIFEHQPAL